MKRILLLISLVSGVAFAGNIKDTANPVNMYTGANSTPTISAATNGAVTLQPSGSTQTATVNGGMSVSGTLVVEKAQITKQYVVGTTYTNGTPTITNSSLSGWSVVRGVLIPYQTYDGAWRLRFNFAAAFTSTALSGGSNYPATITGVTFKNVSQYGQAVSVNTPGNSLSYWSYASPGTSTINIFAAQSGTEALIDASSDVELDSKPTWAD